MDLKHLIPHQRRREFGPALDLQFAADKTLTARVGPTPSFSRGSSATFVDSNGLIKYAPENLIRQSENFGTTWTVNQLNTTGSPSYINVATAPDGQTTADKLIPNTVSGTHQFRQDVSLAASTAYTLSCYFKAGELSNVALAVVGTATGNVDWSCFFDVSTGVTTGSRTGFTSSLITDAGDGWYRCSAVFTTTVAGTASIRISGANTAGNSTFFVGNSASGFYVWGAQLERASTAGTYIPTTASAIYMPRFDHDPITLVCKGLFTEDQRTNLALFSNLFSSWTAGNSSATLSSSVANPEGSLSTWKFVEDLLPANHTLSRSFTPVSGTTYTASMWLKSAENGFAFVGLSGGGFPTAFISVNLSTGAVTTAIGTPIGATSVAYSNGWWRVSFSLAATGSLSSSISTRLSRDGVWDNRSYLGNGVNGMYCYGAQLEAGSHASSYIPTTAAALARSADNCSITGTNFSNFCNQTEGTLISKLTIIDRNSTFGLGGIILAAADRFNCSVSITKKNNIISASALRSYNGSVAQFNFTTVVDIEDKIIFAFKQDSYAASCSGSAVLVDNSGLFQTNTYPLNQMQIGSNIGTRMFGWISSIQYYRQRLPNSQLQSLTT